MSDRQTQLNGLQWKWVGISFLLYVLFYFLPMSVVPGGFFSSTIVTNASIKFIGAWLFAGIFVIAAVSGFISKAVIIKETAVAAVFLVILFLTANHIKFSASIEYDASVFTELFIGTILLMILAAAGSWFGGLVRKRGKKG